MATYASVVAGAPAGAPAARTDTPNSETHSAPLEHFPPLESGPQVRARTFARRGGKVGGLEEDEEEGGDSLSSSLPTRILQFGSPQVRVKVEPIDFPRQEVIMADHEDPLSLNYESPRVELAVQ